MARESLKVLLFAPAAPHFSHQKPLYPLPIHVLHAMCDLRVGLWCYEGPESWQNSCVTRVLAKGRLSSGKDSLWRGHLVDASPEKVMSGSVGTSGSLSTEILAIVACLVASAFVSASETALTALSEARARQLHEEEERKLLRFWLNEPGRVLATLLLVNTIVNTLSAALMTELVGKLQLPNAVAIATGLMTFLLLTFGEITPKTLARQYASTFAPLAMPVIMVFYYLFHPLVTALGAIPTSVQRLIHAQGGDEPRPSITSEEIEYMIDLGVREGVLDEDRSELLTSVLEFADTVTREIMVPRTHVVALSVASSREEVLEVVHESEHSRIPVFTESIDEVIGVLHVRSLLADLRGGVLDTEDFDIHRYLHEPFFVPEQMKISRLLREFQRRKIHLAIVVDEFGGTAGVVALEDVVEEIVGDIQDELDVEEGRVRLLPDGSWIADASITLRDLEDHLGIDFPDELDFDSLGGFVIATAGTVPPVGSVLMWDGLRFTVRQGDERHVSKVEIARVESPAEEGADELGLMVGKGESAGGEGPSHDESKGPGE